MSENLMQLIVMSNRGNVRLFCQKLINKVQIKFRQFVTNIFRALIPGICIILLVSCDQTTFENISSDQYVYQKPQQLPDGYSVSTPEELLLKQENFDRIIKDILDDQYGTIDSVLVVKNNKLILEEYFNGFDRNVAHDLRSATKSITSLLIGIAIQEGFIPDIDEPVYDYFEQDYVYFENWVPQKSDITIRHLLNMSSGLDCNDGAQYTAGHEDQMYLHRDWYRYILDVELVRQSGKYFAYCTAGVNLLGGIIRRASGKSVTEFAEQYLFQKLSINNYQWSYAPNGTEDTGGHLYLTSREFLKLGMVFINDGVWNSKQIINQNWIQLSSEMYFPNYGYLWWKQSIVLDPDNNPKTIDFIYASGNGGQHIFIVPEHKTVIVTTASDYNRRNGTFRLFLNRLLPELITDN